MEYFDRGKLTRSILASLRKRTVDPDIAELIASTVTSNIMCTVNSEVTSKIIGDMVMDQLKRIDRVAFVRYASVYMNFNEATDFSKLVNILISSDK